MKNFLLILLLAPLTLFAQPDDASWLNVTVQTDNYGGESSWEIINSDSNTVAVSPPLANNTLTKLFILAILAFNRLLTFATLHKAKEFILFIAIMLKLLHKYYLD